MQHTSNLIKFLRKVSPDLNEDQKLEMDRILDHVIEENMQALKGVGQLLGHASCDNEMYIEAEELCDIGNLIGGIASITETSYSMSHTRLEMLKRVAGEKPVKIVKGGGGK